MTESNDTEQGFLTLVCRLGYETPRQLFNSITNMNHKEKHKEWYLQIRKVVPVLTEEQRPPTVTALWKHWQRSCWIRSMWQNSSKPNQFDGLPPPESQGWLKESNKYSIDWEDPEVQQEIQSTLNFLTKGCACKTGCQTKRCSCQKNGRSCGAGCECRGCKNLRLEQNENQDEIEVEEDEEEDVEEDDDEENDEDDDDEEDEETIETEMVTDDIDELCQRCLLYLVQVRRS